MHAMRRREATNPQHVTTDVASLAHPASPIFSPIPPPLRNSFWNEEHSRWSLPATVLIANIRISDPLLDNYYHALCCVRAAVFLILDVSCTVIWQHSVKVWLGVLCQQ